VKPYNIIISGGGTGGHIYPAIAIANECKKRWPDCNILFVGAKDRMEMEKVPAAGYEIEGLWISGIQRSLTVKNLLFPFKIMKSLAAAAKIIKRFKPDIAIGTGGYASAPLLYSANKRNIPTLIQEQNSYPGITNKLLSKKANVICVASDGMERFFPRENLYLTGNPVRQDLIDLDHLRNDAVAHFKLDPSRKTLLVLGGSLGSRRINQLIDKELDFITSSVQVIWQCGKMYYETYKNISRPGVQVHQFINRMDLAYSAADFVISRAGASSISELCLVGKPVLFIPSPHVAEDHQRKNAQAVVDKDAALMITEDRLEREFQSQWKQLIEGQELQQRLSKNIKSLGLPRATQDIVDHIEKLLDGSH
jgi:UDP-N-acetylglucosamine--N-acetylmuramyl-(pentapeptide) pyrophosphoryl-undecaprenol N-acetylglucosamine transferase